VIIRAADFSTSSISLLKAGRNIKIRARLFLDYVLIRSTLRSKWQAWFDFMSIINCLIWTSTTPMLRMTSEKCIFWN